MSSNYVVLLKIYSKIFRKSHGQPQPISNVYLITIIIVTTTFLVPQKNTVQRVEEK